MIRRLAFWLFLLAQVWPAHADLGTTLVLGTLGNAMTSNDTLEEGTPASPTYRAQVHTELGAAYFARGQLGVAIQELNEAIESDSSYAPAHNVLGLVYMQLKETDLARRHFERAVSIAPKDSEAQNNYGWFLCQNGQPKEAIGHFMAALKNPLYTTPEKPYLNAGICSLKQHEEAAAEEYFHKALQLQPRLAPALYFLAEIAYKRSDYGEGKRYIERYMQLVAEPSAENLWLAVRIARKGGDRNSEAQYGFMLRKRYPDSGEAQMLREGRYD